MKETENNFNIYVLRDRWVLVGNGVVDPSTNRVTLSNAHVIRVWGTKYGLGELAKKGPRKNTILDPVGSVIIEPHDLKFTIVCDTDWFD